MEADNDSTVSIIIVDDAEEVLVALAEVVSSDPRFRLVGVAGRVRDVHEIAAALPDLALVDVRMPDGGGFEACRRILSVSPSTKVVALSAFSTTSLRRRMRDAGAVAYLTKGMAGDILLDQLVALSAGTGAETGSRSDAWLDTRPDTASPDDG